MHQLERIISGGQTGIDQLGLEVARLLGIPTGGIAPKGYMTEIGPDERLRDVYGLTEHVSANYPPRTRSNVEQSDGTVLFGDVTQGGTKLTVDACTRFHKPYLINPNPDELLTWLVDHQIKILNVAGNRGSGLSKKQLDEYKQVLIDALSVTKKLHQLFVPVPAQWGLRGDPYLWQELAQLGKNLFLPKSEKDLSDLLLMLIKNLIGEDLSPHKLTSVGRYQFGGMSSGVVASDFWLQTAIPLLIERFRKL